jgi:hypothetical protein
MYRLPLLNAKASSKILVLGLLVGGAEAARRDVGASCFYS